MGLEIGWLAFWKSRPGARKSPTKIYDAVRDGEAPAELEDLSVRKIVSALKRRYSDFDQSGQFAEIDVPEEETGIEVSWNAKHFLFVFFGDAFNQMDEVVKLMAGFGLPCFDGDSKTMYTLQKPPPSFQATPEERRQDDAMFGALEERANKSKGGPQEKLHDLVKFMKSGQWAKEVDRRLGESGPNKRKPAEVKLRSKSGKRKPAARGKKRR